MARKFNDGDLVRYIGYSNHSNRDIPNLRSNPLKVIGYVTYQGYELESPCGQRIIADTKKLVKLCSTHSNIYTELEQGKVSQKYFLNFLKHHSKFTKVTQN